MSIGVGTELEPNSTIKTGKGGHALVMLMNGAVISIDEQKNYHVGIFPPPGTLNTIMLKGLAVALREAADLQPIPIAANDARTIRASAPRANGTSKMGRVGPDRPAAPVVPLGKKGTTHIEGVYPEETAIVFSDKLTFEWRGPLSFGNPVLVLEDAQHDRRIFDISSTRSTTITVDANELELKKGGAYSWYIASRHDKPGRGRTRRFTFHVLTDRQEKLLKRDFETIDRLAQTPDGRFFMKGQLYFNYRMHHEMVETLLPLWKKYRSSTLKQLVRLGCARLGRPDVTSTYQ